MVRTDDVEIVALDGRPIGATVIRPNVAPRAQLVIHGATAVPQRFYQRWAHHLAARGVAVVTYDYRGVGRSRSLPIARDPATMTDWIDDARVVQRWAARREPGVPLVAVGHSFGGQIATVIRPGADAIITVGAQGGYIGRFNAPRRQWLSLLMHGVIPGFVRAMGYLPGWAGLGEDLPAGVALQWARWCTAPDYLLSELPELRARMAAWRGPMFALSFDDDAFAPLQNVRWLLDRFGGADLEHRHVHVASLSPEPDGGVGHFGFFRDHRAGELWPMVDEFLQRLGVAPIVSEDERVLADLQYGMR
ncbi:MAG: alpha/beta fold hydrolase [Nannocystaceae bacterium]|nr:alpha/beta fold hydrolase [Nannocystaceae bacterium]